MTALEIAEEALRNLHTFAAPYNRLTDKPWAQMETDCREAIAALSAARDGDQWRPIAELPEDNTELFWMASWSDWLGQWTKNERQYGREVAMCCGYTHFCRITFPAFPPPPPREVKP